ncbi:MAG: DEAD/DEAH box helicase, partial [Halothece sp.]
MVQQLTLFNQQSQNKVKQFPAQRSSPQFGNSNQKEQKPGLRPYQKSAIAECYRLIRLGYSSPLIYAPTGSGKTVMASHIVKDAVTRSRRVLFLVHRDALVKQTRDTLIGYGIPEELIGYIKAGYPQASEDHQVIVASVQSLARRNYPANIGLIIVDECHTTAFYADFGKIREAYQHDGQKGAIIIGLSASPWRNKAEIGMKHAGFDSLVKAATITGLVQEGYLAPPRYFGFGGMMDLSQFETRDGDYKVSQVQNAVMAPGFNEKVVAEYKKLCPDRTAIAFCASIEQSRYLAELFNDTDIAAEHLEGNTPTEVREEMYQRLSNGETRVLCSVGTLTEGFDVKSIGAIILARPTKSISLYVQICGRGLRPYPGKKDCYILD